jgi:serine/threonine-protein kinase
MIHPERLGKYLIESVLGEGAMGIVYKAHDPGINRPVAIKTIRKSLMQEGAGNSSLAVRFRNEAQAVGRLSHPGIVAIYDYGEDESTAYIAMEFVQGRNLSQVLTATPMLPESMVRRFMLQLLDALEYAHRHGVWHRDIKPANLIVTAAGQLKIADFGVARIESAAITQVAAAIGTPGYMAPEQYTGEAIDHRVDIFAAGVLLYRLLTGQQPFGGTTPQSVMHQILNKDPVAPSQVPGVTVPEFYDPIVLMALARDAKRRFASAARLREALVNRNAYAVSNMPDETGMSALPEVHLEGPDAASTIEPSDFEKQALPSGVTGWDEATLKPLEAALTQFVGPMAKLLVREAARRSMDMSALQQALAQHLQNNEDRARFATLLAPAVQQHPSVPPPLRSQPLSTGNTTNLADIVVDHARQVLTSHMGPIAKVMLKKALLDAQTPEQLFDLLGQQVPDPMDRARLLEDLRRRPKPR